MDLDGDGNLDILSGSYPGELYLFRGLDEGGYAAAETLHGADGDPLNLGSAAAPFAVDLDLDGDLDLLVGDIRGHVWFVPNESGDRTLRLGEASRLEVDGQVIRVPGGDAGPTVADWDGDGRLDLLVGCGDGSVRLHRIAVTEAGIEVEAHQALVAASKGGMSRQPGEAPRPGARVKPCVVDYDGDGKLDLLLGDVAVERAPPPDLDEADAAALERNRRRLDWLHERYIPRVQALQREVLEELGVEVGAGGFNEAYGSMDEAERSAYAQRWREAFDADVELAALSRLIGEVNGALRANQSPNVVHGYVWIYRRR